MKHTVTISITDDEETGLLVCGVEYDPPLKEFDGPKTRAQYAGQFIQKNLGSIIETGRSKHGKNWYKPDPKTGKYGDYRFAKKPKKTSAKLAKAKSSTSKSR